MAVRRRFGRDPVIDDGMLLWFPAPGSFTGEDVVELHVHGGRAGFEAMARTLIAAGARPAEAGEFTRRAFQNGKMDLAQAEAVADLVAAETEAQRRQALRQLDGDLGRLYEAWRGRLIAIIARAEAAIDFPEEDLPADLLAGVAGEAGVLAAELSVHLDDGRRGERLREGFHVAILGAPNAGKSSLLNALVGRSVAIVHPTAGTTRDVVEAAIDLDGWPILLSDTAGLRESDDPVEVEGIRRAHERAATADLKLLVVDASCGDGMDEGTARLVDRRSVVVRTKVDLAADGTGDGALRVSAVTGSGIGELTALIAARAEENLAAPVPAPTRLRHREAVETAVRHLQSVGTAPLPELMAEDLRLAARALGRAVGRIDVEDVLDAVFRQFCIGK